MKWRGSRFRRWIFWLKSLLRVREGVGFEPLPDLDIDSDLGSGFASGSSVSSFPRRRNLEREWVRTGLKGREHRWVGSGLRMAHKSLLPELPGSPLRSGRGRAAFQKSRVYKKQSAILFSGIRHPLLHLAAQTEVRSRWASANKASQPEARRRRSLDELKSLAEKLPKIWSSQAPADSNRHKSATFSPPLSPRLVQKPKPAKPGREPPLWLSLGPHLARQIKQ